MDETFLEKKTENENEEEMEEFEEMDTINIKIHHKRTSCWKYVCETMAYLSLYVFTTLCVITYFLGLLLPKNNIFYLNYTLLVMIDNGLSLFLALHNMFAIPKLVDLLSISCQTSFVCLCACVCVSFVCFF